jgi:hypothetical protein
MRKGSEPILRVNRCSRGRKFDPRHVSAVGKNVADELLFQVIYRTWAVDRVVERSESRSTSDWLTIVKQTKMESQDFEAA